LEVEEEEERVFLLFLLRCRFLSFSFLPFVVSVSFSPDSSRLIQQNISSKKFFF